MQGAEAVAVFSKSGLTTEVLRTIWFALFLVL